MLQWCAWRLASPRDGSRPSFSARITRGDTPDEPLFSNCYPFRAYTALEITLGGMSLAFQSVPPGDYFELTPDRVLNGDYGVHLEHK